MVKYGIPEWTEEDLEFPYGLNIGTQVEMLNMLEEAWIALGSGPMTEEQNDLACKIASFLYRIEQEEEV